MARACSKQLAALALACAVLVPAAGVRGDSGDGAHYAKIRNLAERGSSAELRKEASAFRKNHPSSPHWGDVRFFEAEHAASAGDAVTAYRSAAEKLPGPKAALARSRACEILYLSSRWDELYTEARGALKRRGGESRAAEFMLYQARACIFTEKYETAARLCGEITKTSHDYGDLSSALLLLSHIERKTTGYSRSYFATLRDLVTGFPNSDIAPTALYLLGRSYHERGDFGRAHSAYVEISRKHPRSPEAVYAAGKLKELEGRSYTPADHVPTDEMLKSLETIDLRHDNVGGDAGASGPVYSVSLGPLESAREAQRVAKLVKDDFGPVRIVNLGGRYAVYAGRHADTRGAMTMKIRLAEEMGFNGRIVRIVKDDERTYIYGD